MVTNCWEANTAIYNAAKDNLMKMWCRQVFNWIKVVLVQGQVCATLRRAKRSCFWLVCTKLSNFT